jgi:hypothetical protein
MNNKYFDVEKENYLYDLVNSDFTSIAKQSYLCILIEEEEKSLDSVILHYKDFLFGQILFKHKEALKGEQTFSKETFSSLNTKKNNSLIKYSLLWCYFTLQKFFRKWKSSYWQYKSFSEVIDQYKQSRERIDMILVLKQENKDVFQKKRADYDLLAKNLCENCLSNTKISQDLHSLKSGTEISIDENSDVNKKDNQNSAPKIASQNAQVGLEQESIQVKIENLEKRIKITNNKLEKECSAYEKMIQKRDMLLLQLSSQNKNNHIT